MSSQTPTQGSTYVVVSGDTLSGIAQQAYGDQSLWPEIYNANTQVIGSNPNLIKPGQALYIPKISSQTAPTPGSTYVVVSGDTLSGIAQQAYGNQSLWPEIYNANIQVIGNNPNLIKPGQALYIPVNPQSTRVYPTAQNCTVTVASLHVRDRPTTDATIVASYTQGTVLNFIEVVVSQSVDGNANWGHSTQGHYFWLGGTNRPNG